jgi:hypothetical protein
MNTVSLRMRSVGEGISCAITSHAYKIAHLRAKRWCQRYLWGGEREPLAPKKSHFKEV